MSQAQIRDDGNHVMEPVWHEGYDVAALGSVGHPGLPAPPQVVKAVAELLRQASPV